jgi:hypothetical protein
MLMFWYGMVDVCLFLTLRSIVPKQEKEYAKLADDPNFAHVREDIRNNWRNCIGRFSEFGYHCDFDDEDIYWAALPEPPSLP